jgi:acyl-coenzyme A thioesterase PaaI-like protein
MSADLEFEPSAKDPFVITRASGGKFSELVDTLREVQEAVTCSRPADGDATRAIELLKEAAAALGERIDEDSQLAGRLYTEAGRAQALAPPLHLDEITEDTARGHVTFGRFYAGHGAVHGGVLPLIFDEIMARLAQSGGRPFSRTAYLNTDYRALVPLDTEVEVRARLVSEEGRKVFVEADIRLGDEILTECEGLWVQVRVD